MRDTIKSKGKEYLKHQAGYWLLSAPSILSMLVFSYLPMVGVIIAFKDYKYKEGIFGSPWAGFKHFKFFFESNDAVRVIGNTLFYSLASLLVVGLFVGALLALMLYEVRNKYANKLYQTSMLLPFFLSWVVVSGVLLMLLNHSNGFANQFLEWLGLDPIMWYNDPKYWRTILVLVNLWHDGGMASLYFYAALLSIDNALFEAAALDGASRLKQIWYISIPCLKPMACITIITRLGNILSSSFEMFYQATMNNGALYPTTDVISTYLQRGLESGSFSATAAVGLFQSFTGLVLVLISNAIIKKISPEDSLF